jgi:hypothetical protein
MDAISRSFGPAAEASGAWLYAFFTQRHHLHLGTGCAHTVYQGTQHNSGFALTVTAGTGIQGHHFHWILLFYGFTGSRFAVQG